MTIALPEKQLMGSLEGEDVRSFTGKLSALRNSILVESQKNSPEKILDEAIVSACQLILHYWSENAGVFNFFTNNSKEIEERKERAEKRLKSYR